jgi:hypothetical protein
MCTLDQVSCMLPHKCLFVLFCSLQMLFCSVFFPTDAFLLFFILYIDSTCSVLFSTCMPFVLFCSLHVRLFGSIWVMGLGMGDGSGSIWVMGLGDGSESRWWVLVYLGDGSGSRWWARVYLDDGSRWWVWIWLMALGLGDGFGSIWATSGHGWWVWFWLIGLGDGWWI